MFFDIEKSNTDFFVFGLKIGVKKAFFEKSVILNVFFKHFELVFKLKNKKIEVFFLKRK